MRISSIVVAMSVAIVFGASQTLVKFRRASVAGAEPLEELGRARIERLAEPEHRVAAHLLVLFALRYAHELLKRFAVAMALPAASRVARRRDG